MSGARALKPVRVESVVIPLYRFGDGRVGPVFRENGRRIKRPFTSEAKARVEAEKIAIRLANKQQDLADFTAADREIYLHVKQLLSPHGVALTAAVEQWIGQHRDETSQRAAGVGELVEQLIDLKREHKLSARYMRGLTGDLRDFAQKFACPLLEVRSLQITGYLRALGVGERRRNNIRDEIVTLFLHAKEHGYLPEDKITEAEKVKRIVIDHEPVKIYTPAQLRIILNTVSREWLPWIALGAFAGLRPEETALWHTTKKGVRHKLLWSDFNWTERELYVSRFIAKKTQRGIGRDRYVPINDTLFAWLAPWHTAAGPVCPEERPDRETARLGERLGFEWIADGLRHSFASYWQSLHRNIEKLTDIMGNSVAINLKHYQNPRPEAGARKWFGVMPDAEENKVIPLPLVFTAAGKGTKREQI